MFKIENEIPGESQFALLTSLSKDRGTISAGERKGVKVGMKLTIFDFSANRTIGYFIVKQVKQDEAIGHVETLPNENVYVGSKVILKVK